MICGVAPPAGAWIETTPPPERSMPLGVAPPAGAWIETCRGFPCSSYIGVAPPAGAWIETQWSASTSSVARSRPLRARGSKPPRWKQSEYQRGRAPCGRVDRNRSATNPAISPSVAPPAGAWIETSSDGFSCRSSNVAPPAGAWIETSCSTRRLPTRARRAPCGRVDRNQ